ncbi:hypothetical protein D9M69_690120 [compost metagenome]
MAATGMAKERVGGVLHALDGYAALLDPNAPRRATPAAGHGARSSWWKRLFG